MKKRNSSWFLSAALCALLSLTACTNNSGGGISPSPSLPPSALPSASAAPSGTESGPPAATMVPGNDAAATHFQAGTYSAAAKGMHGDVTVEVTFTDSVIQEVQVTSHQETDGKWEEPVRTIPQAIVDGQTLDVQAVSGATLTSNAILQAVEDCVRQAGGDPAALKTGGSHAGGSGVIGGVVNGVGDVVDEIGDGIHDAGDAIDGTKPSATPYNSSRPVTTAKP